MPKIYVTSLIFASILKYRGSKHFVGNLFDYRCSIIEGMYRNFILINDVSVIFPFSILGMTVVYRCMMNDKDDVKQWLGKTVK